MTRSYPVPIVWAMKETFLPGVEVKKERAFIIFLLLCSLAIQAWAIAYLDFGLLDNDDAYYYFEIAKNFPAHHQLTFDGQNLTNGVQPLFAAVLCLVSLILKPLALEPRALAKCFLFVCAIFNTAAAYAFFRWGRDLAGRGLGWLLLLFFAFGAFTLRNRLIGMENSLYALALGVSLPGIFSLLHYQKEDIPIKRLVAGGAYFALLFLCRVDSIFLLVITGLWLLVQRRRRRLVAVREVALIGLVALVLVSPYLIYNQVFFNHLFPISGTVKLFYTRRNAAEYGGMLSFSHFARVAGLYVFLPLKFFSKMTEYLKSWFLGYPHFLEIFYNSFHVVWRVLLFILPGALMLIAAGRHLFKAGAAEWRAAGGKMVSVLRATLPLHVFSLVHMAVASFMYPKYIDHSGVGWWFMPSYVSSAVIMMAVLDGVFSVDNRDKVIGNARLVLFAILVALNTAGYGHVKSMQRRAKHEVNFQLAKYRAALWINHNLPEDAKVGSFNAGILGYYSQRVVVNLDGLANDWRMISNSLNT